MKFYNVLFFCLMLTGIFTMSSFSFTDKSKDNNKSKDANGYTIKIKIKGLKDTICYLGYYFADKQYVLDTERVDVAGNVVFSGNKPLDGGIYFIYSPDRTLIQFLVSDAQKFSMETDTADLIKNMKITGSAENILFSDFHKHRMLDYNRVQALKKRLDKNKGNKDSTAFINKEIEKIDTDMLNYMKDAVQKNPGTLYSSILKSNLQIDIPDAPKDANGKDIDSLFALHFLQKHFFDNVNFDDGRLVRTPILNQKIMDYLKRLVVPHPDSIIRSCDFIINKAKADTGVFRYVVPTLTNYYETSKYMGMDAVFVHLAKTYYLSGEVWWADSTLLAKMGERVRDLEPTLIGGKAHNIVMYDTLLKQIPLYSIKALWTVLFFYEPDCGHCKKATPKMVKLYEKYKPMGVEIFGVDIKTDIEEWKKFIKEYKTPWINVADPYYKSYFRNYFDIYSTPVIYFLDKDKKILAKRLSPEQLEDMIRMKLGIKGDEGRVLEKPKEGEEEKDDEH